MDAISNTKSAKAGSFQSMNLSKDILSGLNRMGYKVPTPVQRKALPIALAGMDIVCMSRTGSGKTCAFLVPLLEKIKSHSPTSGVRAVILSPTRELAMQTYKFAKDMAKFTDLRIASIIGGDPIEPQFQMLADRPDIIIATPGRLMHLLREISTFKLKSVEYLVFDEADRLFEMGFAEQLNEIIRECPSNRQTLLFSATMPKMLVQFARAGLRDPQLVRLDAESKLSEELRLAFFTVRSNEKISALLYIVRKIIPPEQQTIIFTATRHHSELIYCLLEKLGISSTLVYGTMDQDLRNENLRSFRNGSVKYLVVTDLAARGIDVPLLNNVINFHFPASPKLFVHRCGRAARQGRIGYAFSLIDPEEFAYAMDVHLFLGKQMINPLHESHKNNEDVEECVTSQSVNDLSSVTVYDLTSMVPSMIHTGMIPQDSVDQETEYVRTQLNADHSLATTWRISENAMKQYKRTRTSASREAVKKSRETVQSQSLNYIHPLVMGCDPKGSSAEVLEKTNFVKHLQSFRPQQTVFESGIGFGTGTQAVKGVSKKGSKESKGVEVMKALRKELRQSLQRNRIDSAVQKIEELDTLYEGTEENFESENINFEKDALEDSEWNSDVEDDEYKLDDQNTDETVSKKMPTIMNASEKSEQSKIRVSRAARKKMKSGNSSVVAASSNELKQPKSYQDEKYFMSYGTENETANYVESSLQPQSGLKNAESFNATMMENAILDITPDDALEMNNKRRMLRWDAKKKNFVKQSLQEMADIGKGAKRVRSEAGVAGKTSSRPAGEMYENWRKKTKREVELAGIAESEVSRPNPNFTYNSKIRNELRNVNDVKGLKKKRENDKLKNMSKDKRKSVLGIAKKIGQSDLVIFN